MKQSLLATAMLALVANTADARPIERACNGSGRNAANPQLCACIQQAADQTLSGRDQARAAKFFRDPHKAQVVRQSNRASDEAFWRRYRAFGETAELRCGATG